jgi:competence protein ComEA
MDRPQPAKFEVNLKGEHFPLLSTIWPRAGQWLVAFLLGVSAALLAVHSLRSSRWSTMPTTLERGSASAYRIDLNEAGRAELLQLPGVGESLAGRIEDHRRQYGAFQNVDELTQVHGIGPTLERLRPWLRVTSDSSSPNLENRANGWSSPARTKKTAAIGQTPSGTGKEAKLRGPIDVNEASVHELQQLPGIGPAKAQRIIEERERKPFQSIDDLRRVTGIGAKTLERLRPYVMVEMRAVDATPSSQVKPPPASESIRVQ